MLRGFSVPAAWPNVSARDAVVRSTAIHCQQEIGAVERVERIRLKFQMEALG